MDGVGPWWSCIEVTVCACACAQTWQNLPAGGTVGGIGANIWATTNNLAPTAGSINGISCTIKRG